MTSGRSRSPRAIATQARQIADKPSTNLLAQPNDACHAAMRAHVVTEMTAALTHADSTYTAPDGVRFSLSTGPIDRRF